MAGNGGGILNLPACLVRLAWKGSSLAIVLLLFVAFRYVSFGVWLRECPREKRTVPLVLFFFSNSLALVFEGRLRGDHGGAPRNQQVPAGVGALDEESGRGQAVPPRVRPGLPGGGVLLDALVSAFCPDRRHAGLREAG